MTQIPTLMFTVAIASLFFCPALECTALFASYILFMRQTTERKSNYPVFSQDLLSGDCGMPSPVRSGCSVRYSLFNHNHKARSVVQE